MDDVLIIGGGVIGLSLAYELSGHGPRVRVIDQSSPGREASWAGAGILPAAVRREDDPPYQQLAGLSHELHPKWAAALREETGVDTGFRRSGGVQLAHTDDEAAELEQTALDWRRRGVAHERLTPADLRALEPALAEGRPIRAAYFVPDESQLRNPRHVGALAIACAARGVAIEAGVSAAEFLISGGRVEGVRTSRGRLSAGAYCIAAGAWSGALAARLEVRPSLKPVRGQIALLHCRRVVLSRIVNVGRRYLTPRPDGRVLVGSTEEDVGFDKRTTSDGVAGLLKMALEIAPALAAAEVERTWAGLRPGTADGMPYLGRLPSFENVYLAAGHFRAGLHLSTGTAVVMGRLMRGLTPEIDLAPFRVDRD